MQFSAFPRPVVSLIALFAALLFSANVASAHCQIPCGIFDDDMMMKKMLQDVTTIEKSVAEINKLADKTDAESINQRTRWIMNKEDHANNVITIISEYYLAQRVKASQDDYVDRLKKHHAVMVAAMKTKQNVDQEHVEALRQSIMALRAFYPEPDHHHHH